MRYLENMKCILSPLYADSTGQINRYNSRYMSSNPWKGYLANFDGHMKGEKVGGHLLKVEVDPLGLQRIPVNKFTAAAEANSRKVEKN